MLLYFSRIGENTLSSVYSLSLCYFGRIGDKYFGRIGDKYFGRIGDKYGKCSLQIIRLIFFSGLSPDLQSMEQIRRIMRPTDVPDQGLLCDLLWSDPDKETMGWGENDRGVSFTFGAEVVAKFLHKHDLDLICRAHQVLYALFSSRYCYPRTERFGGWSGGAKVLCILHHWGVQLILAYSWARPAILVVGKVRGGMFLFLLFIHFHSCSSFFPVPLFHLLYSLFYLFSPFLWETIQNDPQGLTCR